MSPVRGKLPKKRKLLLLASYPKEEKMTFLIVYIVVGFVVNFTVQVVRGCRNSEPCPDIPLSWEIPVYLIQIGLFVAGWVIWPLVLAVAVRSFLRWRKARE